jgi:uncharacterized protein
VGNRHRPTLRGLRRRREEILRIAATHGAHNVHIFGSVARGHSRPDSDVDFLVEFDTDRTVLDLSGLIIDLQDALGRHVDVVEFNHTVQVPNRIKAEAVPL